VEKLFSLPDRAVAAGVAEAFAQADFESKGHGGGSVKRPEYRGRSMKGEV
jgi:hypothetical protein